MQSGAAAALREVDVFSNGDVHVSIEPNTKGAVLDSHGEVAVVPKKGLMVKIDAKAVEQITLSKGTVIAIGAVPAFLTILVVVGGLLIGYGRSDQSQVEKQIQLGVTIDRVADSQKRMEDQFRELDKRLQEQEKLNERVKGYQLGQTDAGATGHKEK